MLRSLVVVVVLAAPTLASAQDVDGDTVPDARDLCPHVAEVQPTIFPGDGCPDADADHDRIVDDYDVCPDAAETVNQFEDADGCPDAAGASVSELAERIHFATGDHALDDAARAVIVRLAAYLSAHPEIEHADVIGHADARGDTDANRALSERRAASVRDALVAAGVATTRLGATGAGALPGDSAEVQAENRRCEIVVRLADDARIAADLTTFAGLWIGDARMDVDVGARPSDSAMEMQPAGSDAVLACYAGRVIGDRVVLVCRGMDREETFVLRREATDASHGVGVVESRSDGGIDRIPWTGHRIDGLDATAVVRMITAHRSAIQGCYQRELRTSPTIQGRIAVTLTIERSGSVTGVQATDAMTPPAPAVAACVVRVIQGFRFSRGLLRGRVTYTFPFVFEPQN